MFVKFLKKVGGPAFLVLASPAFAAVNAAAPQAPRPAVAPAPTVASPAAADAVKVRVLLVPVREAKISSQMEGRVINLPIKEGGSFTRGALIAEFDCEHQQAQLSITNAAVAKAKSVLGSKVELQKHAAIGDLEVSLANADLDDANARLKQAQALVRDCRIFAPYNGRVVKRLVNQFENVGAGMPLMEIQETGRLKLEALLPSRVLAWVKQGTVFKVHVEEIDKEVSAVVTGLGSRIDSVSQTIGISAEVQGNVTGLLPGMSGSATIKKP